jgi:hypothetical protein
MRAGTWQARMGVVGILGATALGLVVLATPAAALPSNCSQDQRTVTCTFASTGAEQSLAVPSDVASVAISATGAAGGSNGLLAGGGAAAAFATIAVVAGSTLYVEVGGAGTPGTLAGAGGFNGGGAGGTGGNGSGGGGGGASDVRTISCGGGCPGSGASPSSRLVVAGGGGGTGAVGPHSVGGGGGAAGATGGDGADDPTLDTGGAGGGAGTSSAGGAFGAGGSAAPTGIDGGPGGAGSAGQGGTGAGQTNGGGGGGAGYYGGGGGGGGSEHTPGTFDEAGAGGGGGGSSYAPGGSTALAAPGAPPSVTIAYTLPEPPAAPSPVPAPTPTPPAAQPPTVTIAKPVSGARFAKRQHVLARYTCADGANGPGIHSCTGTVRSGEALGTTKTGKRTFTVTAVSIDGQTTSRTVSYRVVAPPAKTNGDAELVLERGKSKITASGTISSASGPVEGAPLPGSCTEDRVCQALAKKGLSGRLEHGTVTLAAPLGRAILLLTPEQRSKPWKSGTLTVSFDDGIRTVTLVYTFSSPFIKSVSTPAQATGKVLLGKIAIGYSKMSLKSCTPTSSC